ncbi:MULTISPECIES: Scr1 family TA system antitoxin-like transcriptional regulator [unclassified Streptomyces]|uniref:helix-turn-helix domain-containing protein n=1 Tax=unclassified Streptomyces TaxID=2593676 RepID=UPI003316761F
MSEGVDEAGWDIEPGDEIESIVQAVGRLLKLCREAAGVTVPELAEAMGYGEDLIRKIERGARIPRPEFLDKVDTLLKAQGHLRAFMEDMRKARYPKKVRELAELEGRAIDVLLYSTLHIHGLLQTEEYARAMFGVHRPAHSPDVLEAGVAARTARQSIFERTPMPELSFVQEQVTLERPVGGAVVLRRQLEHLSAFAFPGAQDRQGVGDPGVREPGREAVGPADAPAVQGRTGAVNTPAGPGGALERGVVRAAVDVRVHHRAEHAEEPDGRGRDVEQP